VKASVLAFLVFFIVTMCIILALSCNVVVLQDMNTSLKQQLDEARRPAQANIRDSVPPKVTKGVLIENPIVAEDGKIKDGE